MAAALLCPAALRAADELPEPDLALTYGEEGVVEIATGVPQLQALAPSVTSVITARDIEAMGATDLDEILETVPGIHVARSVRAYNPIYVIRGIYSETNPQVLVLVNGVPITNLFVGDRSQVWGGMPVQAIARIEIIRGPGSAVYGADAFAGVINVITKSGADIQGLEAGARVGRFLTREAWLLAGRQEGRRGYALSLEAGTTDGARPLIQADAQTQLDALLGSAASLAPGPASLGRRWAELRLELERPHWRLRAGYQGRRRVGTGAGVAQALDPEGRNAADRYNADLELRLWEGADSRGRLRASAFNSSARSRLRLYPPGAFGGAFPEGVLGNPDVNERHLRLELTGLYTGWAGHRLRLGAGAAGARLYKVRESRNFAYAAGGLAPLGGLQDVSFTAPFVQERSRRLYWALGQDEWDLARDWRLTAGLRYDHYSDFGGTLNPRAALVWQSSYALTTKLLFGRAFRAPSFAELYNINNPVALGNPALRPETIRTWELAFDYRPAEALRGALSLFRYRWEDIIRFVPDPAPATTWTARNTGSQTGQGLELELSWRPLAHLALRGHYAYQRAQAAGQDPGNAPHHLGYLRLDWEPRPLWALDLQGRWVGKRPRSPGDGRPPLGGYAWADLTLRRRGLARRLELAGSVRNLFDRDRREPTLPALGGPAPIPGDLPLPGRSWWLELRYRPQPS
ncbi:MAG: TonB-dependent receptor [Gammaproteobacteria bacterium]|nr:MAG: TonB-dependent receptor [Gammaproteobacteria bacterium]